MPGCGQISLEQQRAIAETALRAKARLGNDLRSHRGNRGRGGTHEHETGVGTGLRELRVLGEKAVAGMDCLRARRARGVDDPPDVEITLARRRGADPYGLIRLR